jgi:exopolyphosphatase/guanosine-5'-triphosphate,3'-diphosphate pyrophosphatase
MEQVAPSVEKFRRPTDAAFAAIDLGTNNCRLLVGAPEGEGFRVLDSFSRMVRLGEGLEQTGRLSPKAMDRAMVALQACAARLARRPVRNMRAIATEACRRASNGREFLANVQEATGIEIEVISPREEVELALESCAPLLARGGRALLFDIGGGSTELAWVRLGEGRPTLMGFDSLPIGVVTLAERFAHVAYSPFGFQAMVDEIAEKLLPFERIHRIAHEIRRGGVHLLGTSGTVTTLAGVVLGLSRYRRPLVDGIVLSGEDADQALRLLQELGQDGLHRHPCIGPERADFVLPGCAVFAAIRMIWPAEKVVVADRGLREGMLLRMMHGQAKNGIRSNGARGKIRAT